MTLGGGRSELGGNFVDPTILTNVSRDMRVFSEEIFGPVAPLFKFETEEEVVQMANDTEFGLAAYFYSRDIGRVYRVSEQLEYGIIGVNEGIISNEMAPFGGVKESGSGREVPNTAWMTIWQSNISVSVVSISNLISTENLSK